MTGRILDGAAAGLVAAFGLATLLLFIPGTIDDPGLDDLPPAFMPQTVAGLLTGLALLLGLHSLARQEEGRPESGEPAFGRRQAGFVLLAALWLAASFAVMLLAGYLAGGAVAVAGAMLLMRIRRPLTVIAAAALAPLLLWVAFRHILTIPLP